MQICQVNGCERMVLVKSRGLCQLHYHRQIRTGDVGGVELLRIGGDPRERWQQLVRVESPGCWIWTGALDKYGYGQIDVREGSRKNWRAHRWVYTVLVRELAPNETLDHLCRVHACVNPDHLEPVSHSVNVGRGAAGMHNAVKTHCPQGHLYDEHNTILRKAGGRDCRTCQRNYGREYMRSKRAKEKAMKLTVTPTFTES